MESYDHYAEAKIIAEEIAARGFVDQATSIRDAIGGGRSGTGIFMKIRFFLTPLENSDTLDLSTLARISVLLEKVNRAFSVQS